MNPIPQIPMPPRSGYPGSDAFQAIVTLLRNRTGLDFHKAFNRVLLDNSDLLRQSDLPHGLNNFHRLLNRSSQATGLPLIADQEHVVGKVARLTNRFVPKFRNSPTALQWDILWRTALQLEKEIPLERLTNRRVGDPEVSAQDWKNANAEAGHVFTLLSSEVNDPVDRGTLECFQGPSVQACHVRGVFRSALKRKMNEDGLTLRQAFEKMKEDEPIFWTLAMLSFEPEK